MDSRVYVLGGFLFRFGAKHLSTLPANTTLTQCWLTVCDAGPASNQHWFSASCLLGAAFSWSSIAKYCSRRLQADTEPMSVKCWDSVAGAGQYPLSPSQYFMLRYLHVFFCVFLTLFFFEILYIYIYTFTVHTIYSTERKKTRQCVKTIPDIQKKIE